MNRRVSVAGFARGAREVALLVAALVAIGVPSGTAAQDRDRQRARAGRDQAQRLDTTVAVERGVILDVNAADGRITVLGWDRAEMEVHATAGSGEFQFSRSARSVRLEARRAGRAASDVTIEVHAPRGTRVVVSTMRGRVEVLDVRGEVQADVLSGNITVRGATGRTAITSVSGDIVASDVEGPLKASAISGAISLSNVRGDVEAISNSGNVVMRALRSDSVLAQVVQGDIEYDGALTSSGRYEFNTHSGNVRLYLADSARGTLELQSYSGKLESTFPLVLQPDAALPRSYTAGGEVSGTSKRALALNQQQRLEFGGGGGARVTVSTFNGDVRISRGPRRQQRES